MDNSVFLTPRALTTSTPASKSRKKKTFVRPVCDICSFCGKEYRCHRSFLKHERGHKIVDNASKYPKIDKITDHLYDNIGNVFHELKQSPACFTKGQQYKELLQLLIESHRNFGEEWAEFTTCIHSTLLKGLENSKFLLPSSLVANLQKNAELLLSDINLRHHLSDLFQLCLAFNDEEMIQFFLADYVLFLVPYIIRYVSECVRGTMPAPVNETGLEVMDNDYLESVYYIGGAKLHAFDKKAKLYPKDKGWKNIGRVIHERLIESDKNPGPPEKVKGWTIAQNRGKLLLISGLLFDFFCGVVTILEKQAHKKRVDYPDVTEKVCQSGVVLLWDDAVGDSMTEYESFKFMNGLIESFCQTFTLGKAQRMMNSVRKKGEAAIPLRHKVAPKSSGDVPSSSK